MLKAGLIGLAIAGGCLALMLLLGLFGFSHFGPCGPADPFTFVLFYGTLLCGLVSLCLAVFGLTAKCIRKLRQGRV
jgi:hypothetical protein